MYVKSVRTVRKENREEGRFTLINSKYLASLPRKPGKDIFYYREVGKIWKQVIT
jgi:hypothetical protein